MFVKKTLPEKGLYAVTGRLERTLERLIAGDFRGKWEATKQLVELGPAAIADLVPLLHDETYDWEVRWFAARTLGQFDHPDALNALIAVLQAAPEPDLLIIAAEGLSHFGAAGVDALVPLLEQPEYRLIAVQTLASIQHSAAFGPLLGAAADPDPAVRAKAISALANFHHAEVDKLLLSAVQDVSMAVRREAIAALGLRPSLLAQVNLVSVLLPGLWDIHPEINEVTAISLGKLGTEAAVVALARVLSSPHTPENLQSTVIRALGWIERESALQALMAPLPKLPLSLQIKVAETLTRFQTGPLQQRAGDVLCDWLKTHLHLSATNSQLIAAIALALGNLHYQTAIPLLTQLQENEDPQVQLYAQAALRKFNGQPKPDVD